MHRARAVVVAVGTLLAGCRAASTSVRVVLDTDAPSERAMSVRVVVRRNTATTDAAIRADNSLAIDDVRPRLPGSFTVRPAADRAALALLEILADVGAGASVREPSVQLRRLVRFGFVQGRTQQLRVVLALRCGERSRGCTQVAAEQCTVQQVCEELGQTCGEGGRCVPIDQPPGEPEDAAVDDGSRGVPLLPPTANTIEGASSSYAYSMSTDPADDSIALAGTSNGTGTFLGRPVPAGGAYLARIESDLRVRWLRSFGTGTSLVIARALGVDRDTFWNGGYYLADASWTLDSRSFPAAPVRQRSILCRYNDDGTSNRCLDFGSSGANAQTYRAAALNDVAAFGGVVNGTWDLELGGTGSGDDGSLVVVRNDVVTWVRRIIDDGGSPGTVTGVAVDSDGAVYAGGSFSGTLRVNGSAMTGTSTGMLDAYVARFSPMGALEWVRTFGSATSDDIVSDLALTSSGTLYAVGSIGPDSTGLREVPAFDRGLGMRDAMLVAFDTATGTVSLARRYGTPETDALLRVSIAADATVLLGGTFGASGMSPLPAFSAPIRTGMAILSVDRTGAIRWGKPLYVAGTGDFTGVGHLRRAERIAFAATITLDAGQGAPSWAPSIPVQTMRTTGVLGTFSQRDVIEQPR